MRKGRCSNDPADCSLAAQGVDLPYAGPGSLCPECQSPLALVAGAMEPEREARPAQWERMRADEPARRPAPSPAAPTTDAFETPGPRPGDVALKGSLIAVGLIAIGAVAWFALSNLGDPAPDPTGSTQQPGGDAAPAPEGLQTLFPAEIRRVAANVEAFRTPEAGAESEGVLPEGAVVDMTGRVTIAGVSWARITLPGNAARSAYVPEDRLAALSDNLPGQGAATSLPAVDPVTGLPIVPGATAGGVPGAPAQAPAAGPVEPVAARIMYVTARLANVRATPEANAVKVAQVLFGDTLTVTAQQMIGERLWYRVELPTGGAGWIHGELLMLTPPRQAPDAPAAPAAPPADAAPPAPPASTGTAPEDLQPPGVGARVIVVSQTANVRAGPEIVEGNVVDEIGRGAEMKVQKTRVVGGATWLLVTTPKGITGWVSARTVDLVE